MCRFASAAIPCRAPAGLVRKRCDARHRERRRVRESGHPWPTPMRAAGLRSDSKSAELSSLAATQCRDARIRGSTRRSRCRASQAGREKPEGSRRGIAAIAQQYRMYCLRDAAPPRSTGQFDSHDANRTTAVGARPFWLLFGAMPKSNPLARRASGSSSSRKKTTARNWIMRGSCRAPCGPFAARMFATASCLRSPAFAGMTSERNYSNPDLKTVSAVVDGWKMPIGV